MSDDDTDDTDASDAPKAQDILARLK